MDTSNQQQQEQQEENERIKVKMEMRMEDQQEEEVQPQQIRELPTIQMSNNHNNNNRDEDNSHRSHGGHSTRYTPYKANNVTFQERLELIDQIISMFPLLEKDTMIYSILNKNGWSVEKSLTEFQKRHEVQEKRAEEKHNKMKAGGGGGGDDSMEDGLNGTQDSEELEDMKDEFNEEEEEEEVDEEAFTAVQFPKLKEDIQTLKEVFGGAYHEFELQGYYAMCNGNLELVIDQLVNEQNQIQKQATATSTNYEPKTNNANLFQPTEVRQPLTSRLSEADKRALQLQLIEEQEKLEKKFSDKKKVEIESHPNKKKYSQTDILKELKELFGSTVEEGVIDWVAYSCQYDLGKAVTQLVDLKNNSLMKKGATQNYMPHLDPNISVNLKNGFDQMLGVQSSSLAAAPSSDVTMPSSLTSQVSFDTLINQVHKLTPQDQSTTTTTTTTDVNNNTKPKQNFLWGSPIQNNNGNGNGNNLATSPHLNSASASPNVNNNTNNVHFSSSSFSPLSSQQPPKKD